eukprot:13110216-Heterocapsa_arctica.AAC.1
MTSLERTRRNPWAAALCGVSRTGQEHSKGSGRQTNPFRPPCGGRAGPSGTQQFTSPHCM